jgi:cbb3-type cytochrome oxidase maturation protein
VSVLFIAVPVALAFAISAVIAFLWTARSGQLDDLETPPLRMLQDETRSTASGRRGVSDAPRARDAHPAQS